MTSPPSASAFPHWQRYGLGCLALVFATTHDYAHIHAGRWWDAFWICNLCAWLIPLGYFSRRLQALGVALTWLIPGTIVWQLDILLRHAAPMPTSWGVHVGGILLSGYGLYRLGRAKPMSPATGGSGSSSGVRVWPWAVALVAVGVAISRFGLPAKANVNVAHQIPAGWKMWGKSTAAFVASNLTIVTIFAAIGQGVSSRLVGAGIQAPPEKPDN